jgi:hypothetical protein
VRKGESPLVFRKQAYIKHNAMGSGVHALVRSCWLNINYLVFYLHGQSHRTKYLVILGCLSSSPNVLFLCDWFIPCSEFYVANELVLPGNDLFLAAIFLLHFIFLHGGCLHFSRVARMSPRLKPCLHFVFKPLYVFPLSLVCDIFIRNE